MQDREQVISDQLHRHDLRVDLVKAHVRVMHGQGQRCGD